MVCCETRGPGVAVRTDPHIHADGFSDRSADLCRRTTPADSQGPWAATATINPSQFPPDPKMQQGLGRVPGRYGMLFLAGIKDVNE